MIESNGKVTYDINGDVLTATGGPQFILAENLPGWEKLAAALATRLGVYVSVLYAIHIFTVVAAAGKLNLTANCWNGCVHAEHVVDTIAEHLGPDFGQKASRVLVMLLQRLLAEDAKDENTDWSRN